MKSLHFTSALLLLTAFFTPNSHGSTYLHSTFQSSNAGAAGRQAVVTENNSNLTPWYIANSSGAANLAVENDSVLGNSLKLGRTYYTVTSFTSVAELAVGETIMLSLDYRFPEAPNPSAESLRIALYHRGDAAPLSGDSSSHVPNPEKYSGYFVGAALGGATSSTIYDTVFRKRDPGNSAVLNSQTTGGRLASLDDGVASGDVTHSLVFSITRGENSSFISLSIDGNLLLSYNDENAPHYIFDTLMISNQTSTGIYMTNIKVEVIPEGQTATLSLLGAGVLFAGMRSRAFFFKAKK